MPKDVRITVHFDNPGEEIEIFVSSEMLMGLFTDMAGVKSSLALLWKVSFLAMAGGFSLISGLILAF